MEESLDISTLDYKGLQGIRYKKILKMNRLKLSLYLLASYFFLQDPGSPLDLSSNGNRVATVLIYVRIYSYFKMKFMFSVTLFFSITLNRVSHMHEQLLNEASTLLIFSRRRRRISMTSNVRILNFLALFSSFFPFQLS